MARTTKKAVTATLERRVRIVFQPIVDMALWRVSGFEALARFDDGVSPAAHLQQAEAEGKREDLELQLIELAVHASEVLPREALVTINASARTITDVALLDMLTGSDRKWGLELYEGSLDADSCEVRQTVSRLGALLLIDDAGSAFSEVPRILELRPDIVKIDRDLLWAAGSDPQMRAHAEAIVQASRAVEARVLVEGVETEAHLSTARALSSDLAQGYFLGVPTAPEDIPGLLQDLQRRLGMDTARL